MKTARLRVQPTGHGSRVRVIVRRAPECPEGNPEHHQRKHHGKHIVLYPRGQPDADTMIRLCRLFDVDIADFYGESGDLAPISNDERDLVDTYRDLTSPHKHVLLAVARELRAAQGKE